MDGAVPHVGAGHPATQVEVDGIAAQTESLSHEPNLGMFDSREGGTGRREHRLHIIRVGKGKTHYVVSKSESNSQHPRFQKI